MPSLAESAELKPATIAAWDRYVGETETRIARETADETRFLGIDFEPGSSADVRDSLKKGQVVVMKLTTDDQAGKRLRVEDGLVHHWRGVVFIRGASVDQILSPATSVESHRQEDLEQSRVLSRDENGETVFLRLKKSAIVTVTYNTEHRVERHRYAPSKLVRFSRSTRIAELEDPGKPTEHEKPVGRDRGFLWRLNSYWRYEDVDGGVIAECESLSLSRPVPFALRLFVEPFIGRTAHESMMRTLDAVRKRFETRADLVTGPAVGSEAPTSPR